jgi:sterol desaturase/sphingolipid hydroxylase (fatty acid hydroxylase superfamily)
MEPAAANHSAFRGTRTARRAIAFWTYPVLMPLALLSHCLAIAAGVPQTVSTLLPIAGTALIITLLERRFPANRAWRPGRADVLNDALYMALVQSLLPRFLAFTTVIALARLTPASASLPQGLWPDHWPVLLQALLMLLCADFLRYWLHRLAHHWPPLWRLHAVHHSPRRLYWFNVGCFHPLEKFLQFLLDTLPFIWLGVPEAVLAMYFVFYAVNGFFQHCNIHLRLGCLNYLVSGPELHRWHHAVNRDESNHNFGNNLIVWDLLFGTRYLPQDRSVGQLGLVDPAYPGGFGAQLLAPFRARLDHAPGGLR